MIVDRNHVAQTGDIPAGFRLIQDSIPLKINKVESVISEAAGQKTPVLRITGIFQRADKKNANGRIYPREILRDAVESIQEDLKARRVMGELDHPADAKIHMDRVAKLITNLWMEGDVVYGQAEVLSRMPCGAMLKALFEHKVEVGVSSRGIGDMKVEEDENGDECYRVQQGYRFVTFDSVAEPSVPGGQLMVMESRQRVRQAADDARRQHEKVLVEEVRKHFQLV
jgi:hypothetical protein